MPRFIPTTPTPSSAAAPTRRGPAAAVLVEEIAPLHVVNGHGKPVDVLTGSDRRLPARRASFRTPPR